MIATENKQEFFFMLRDGINRFCMALADNEPGVSKCKSDYRFF